MHSHRAPTTVRTQLPWSEPTTSSLLASYNSFAHASESPMLSPAGPRSTTVSVVACSTTVNLCAWPYAAVPDGARKVDASDVDPNASARIAAPDRATNHRRDTNCSLSAARRPSAREAPHRSRSQAV